MIIVKMSVMWKHTLSLPFNRKISLTESFLLRPVTWSSTHVHKVVFSDSSVSQTEPRVARPGRLPANWRHFGQRKPAIAVCNHPSEVVQQLVQPQEGLASRGIIRSKISDGSDNHLNKSKQGSGWRLGHRCFSSSSSRYSRGRTPTFRYKRRPPPNSVVLLERFVKKTGMEGSLIAKAPFHLSCYGSYFDDNLDVDMDKNKKASMDRNEFYRDEKERRREENRLDHLDSLISDTENQHECFIAENSRRQKEKKAAREEAEVMANMYNTTILEKFPNMSKERQDRIIKRVRSPVHFKIYGKPHLRVDSYSVLKGRSHASHVFISDAASAEEAVSMMSSEKLGGNGGSPMPDGGAFSPSGSISIFRPKMSEAEISLEGGEVDLSQQAVNALKIYTPSHIMDDPESCLKGKFLVPHIMSKVYLEAEKNANIEFNGKLMEELEAVGLSSEHGSIHTRDLWASEITLASKSGDVVCEGFLEGDVSAEVFGKGHFVARVVVGPRLKVFTLNGDINLWGDCFTDDLELSTLTGHINVRQMYGRGSVVILNHGDASVNVVEGAVQLVVRSGNAFASFDKMTEDSLVIAENGDLTVIVPRNFKFRIDVQAKTLAIADELVNKGDLFLERTLDRYDTGMPLTELHPPELRIECIKGHATIKVADTDETRQKEIDAGYDSS